MFDGIFVCFVFYFEPSTDLKIQRTVDFDTRYFTIHSIIY